MNVGTEKLARRLHSSLYSRGQHRRTQEIPMRYFDEQDRNAAKSGIKNFGRWLASRPIESWGFFVAGFVIARIIF